MLYFLFTYDFYFHIFIFLRTKRIPAERKLFRIRTQQLQQNAFFSVADKPRLTFLASPDDWCQNCFNERFSPGTIQLLCYPEAWISFRIFLFVCFNGSYNDKSRRKPLALFAPKFVAVRSAFLCWNMMTSWTDFCAWSSFCQPLRLCLFAKMWLHLGFPFVPSFASRDAVCKPCGFCSRYFCCRIIFRAGIFDWKLSFFSSGWIQKPSGQMVRCLRRNHTGRLQDVYANLLASFAETLFVPVSLEWNNEANRWHAFYSHFYHICTNSGLLFFRHRESYAKPYGHHPCHGYADVDWVIDLLAHPHFFALPYICICRHSTHTGTNAHASDTLCFSIFCWPIQAEASPGGGGAVEVVDGPFVCVLFCCGESWLL